MNIKVTIIVPVYNGAKYLSPFMESVLAQDYSEFDLICVDDASDDATFEILQRYAKRDTRIHIYQNNTRKGAAASRNFGLEAASTEYVVFLDADDLVENNFLSLLLSAVKDSDVDIAFCEQDRFEGEIYHNVNNTINRKIVREIYKQKFRLEDIDINDAIDMPGNPVIFIIHKSLIKKYHLEFQSLTSSNDTYFVEMIKILARGIVHIQKTEALIHQRQHNQISRISYNRDPMNAYRASIAIKHKLEELNLWEQTREYYICRVQRILATAVRDTKTEANKIQFLNFLQREGLQNLGFSEDLISCDYLRKDKRYICQLFMYGTYQDIEAIEPFDIAIRANVERVKALFVSWTGKRIAFWGIGYRWERLYQWCSSEMQFQYFLADTYKKGTLWNDIEVIDCRLAVEQAEIVVVLNELYLADIIQQIRSFNKALPVFSLEKYIMMEMQVEESWS